MNQKRIQHLEELLDLLYEKLAMFEQEMQLETGNSKVALKLRIKREIVPDIRRYEAEYWELLPSEATLVSDQDAEATLVEVNQAVNSLARVDSALYPPGMMEVLTEIQEKLNKPKQAAAAKLRLTLPIVPLLVSYVLEMDTESVLSQTWQSIRKRFKWR